MTRVHQIKISDPVTQRLALPGFILKRLVRRRLRLNQHEALPEKKKLLPIQQLQIQQFFRLSGEVAQKLLINLVEINHLEKRGRRYSFFKQLTKEKTALF